MHYFIHTENGLESTWLFIITLLGYVLLSKNLIYFQKLLVFLEFFKKLDFCTYDWKFTEDYEENLGEYWSNI